MKKGLRQLTTFSHTIAGNSPFRIDGIAKRNRTDQEIKARVLDKKISAGVLLSATYGHLGLWRLKTCTEGSNPSRSAIQSRQQRISVVFPSEYAKHARIRDNSEQDRTGENGLLTPAMRPFEAFSLEGY
jgi:hypothetical protein